MTATAVRVAQLVVSLTNVRTVEGSNPNRAKSRGLKIPEEKVLTLKFQ